MFSALRTRYGIPGVIATAALVFAMTGGAFAAKYLITSTSQIKPSVLKKLKGKTGPAGQAGAAGAQGQAGSTGPQGSTGANGQAGSPGDDGKSVLATEIPVGEPECEERGGAEFEIEGSGSATEVCNGKEGSPWVAEEAPKGALLKGTWSIQQYTAAAAGETIPVPISTGVPVSTGAALIAIFVPPGGPDPGVGCNGTADAPTPPALENIICVYEAAATNLSPASPTTGSKVFTSGGGVVTLAKSAGAGDVSGYGSWAMLAP